jgi:hypothetical protein
MTQPLRESVWLIPCSGLDDFPESVSTSDSLQLLNGWLALWHPSLIVQTRGAPRWQAADQPPHDFQGVLAVSADINRPKLPSDLAGTAQRGGGWLHAADRDWRALQADWLGQLPEAPTLPPATARKWQDEFAALGYAYLQIQLLTRQLRYTSNLDQILFDSQLDQAAAAAIAGDAAEAEKMLQSCFDQLGQERDHYYSLDVSLIDVSLLAPTTLGAAVTGQLSRPHATTFIASGDLLRQMTTQHPQVAGELKSALEAGRASLAGGLDVERPHPLMSFDALKRDLARGRAAYRELGFQPPKVYTRFSYGQMSDMPLHLRRSGFIAALLIAWQGGTYPSGSHAKFSWEASEGTFLNALAPPLADAHDAATYLTLGRRIAESLDHQHVPVFVLAHWPNSYSPFFELLERVVARTPALGRWQHADDFFEKTDQPYHQEHLPSRKFVFDWLGAEHSSHPESVIAASQQHHRLSGRIRELQNLLNLCYQLEHFAPVPAQAASEKLAASAVADQAGGAAEQSGGASDPAMAADASPRTDVSDEESPPRAVELKELEPRLAQAADAVDGLFDNPQSLQRAKELDAELDSVQLAIAERFARAAGHKPLRVAPGSPATSELVINASSSPQRLTLRSPAEMAPVAGGKWLYASGLASGQRWSMVDVPGYGMLNVRLQPASEAPGRREKTLAPSESLLLNDFLEIQIDPRTGMLRSLHVPGKRGNRLSLQVARRLRESTGAAEFSTAQATGIRVLENSTVLGAIRVQGQLVLRGQRCGEYEIDYQLPRGSRILSLAIRLSQLDRPQGSAWRDAYVLRAAWPNESAVLTLHNCGSRQTWSGGKATAPSLIEIDETDYHTYLLTGGLPCHQRIEQRFLESILAAGAANGGQFELGVGVDLPNPVISARRLHAPEICVPLETSAAARGRNATDASAAAAWLMHCDAKHVVMELEAPLVDATGRCVGMRIHLSEISNKSVTLRIRALREVAEAHRVDYLGGRIAKLTVAGDTTSIALRPSEMTFVDLIW